MLEAQNTLVSIINPPVLTFVRWAHGVGDVIMVSIDTCF